MFAGFHTFIDKSITGTPHIITFYIPSSVSAIQPEAGVGDVICENSLMNFS